MTERQLINIWEFVALKMIFATLLCVFSVLPDYLHRVNSSNLFAAVPTRKLQT